MAKRSPAIAEELEPRFKGSPSLGNTQDGSQDGVLAHREQNASEWSYEDMEADITVSASVLTFKRLVGRKGENITKIRKECEVEIKIQGHTHYQNTLRLLFNRSPRGKGNSACLHLWARQ